MSIQMILPADSPVAIDSDGKGNYTVNVVHKGISYQPYHGKSRMAAVEVMRNIKMGIYHLNMNSMAIEETVENCILKFLRASPLREFNLLEIGQNMPSTVADTCHHYIQRLVKDGHVRRRATGVPHGFMYTANNSMYRIASHPEAIFIFRLKESQPATRWTVYKRMNCAIPYDMCYLVDNMLKEGKILKLSSDLLIHRGKQNDYPISFPT